MRSGFLWSHPFSLGEAQFFDLCLGDIFTQPVFEILSRRGRTPFGLTKTWWQYVADELGGARA